MRCYIGHMRQWLFTLLAAAALVAAVPARAEPPRVATPPVAGTAAALPAPASAAVGTVTFAAGDARIETPGGASAATPLAKGAQVLVGQTIVTAAGGHVHIRFVDDAFVAVRPNSQLAVDDYHYDAHDPAASRVKFTLNGGTGRLITGKGGQANKQGFRLNTPVAAIGVRGTDFVVRASSERTLVAVQQGAVVVSPFANGCTADGSGPCSGALARQLTASLAGTYLEQRGQDAPRLVQVDPAQLPELFAPPRSEEPATKAGAASARGKPTGAGGTAAAGSGNAGQASASGAANGPATPATGSASSADATRAGMAPAGFTGSANIFWGRWDAGSNATLVNSGNYQVIAEQNGFVLLRPVDGGSGTSSMLPQRGEVSFRLVQSVAFVSRGGGFAEAMLADPRLRVDFGRGTFDTSATLRSESGNDSFRARGQVDNSGLFMADPQRSNADISGGLSNGGQEAGYVFLKPNPDGSLGSIGVTRWER